MNQLKNSLYYFSIVMIFVYFSVAIILIFSDGIIAVQGPNRIILAVIILLYTAFKVYRVLTNKRSPKSDEEN